MAAPSRVPEQGRGPLVAVDVGGTKTIVAAVDGLPSDGFHPLRPPVRFATPRDPERFLTTLLRAVNDSLPAGTRPAAVGIGAPGPLEPKTGVIEHSTNLGWRDLPIADLVSRELDGVPVRVGDDGNLGALGEAHAGAGRGADPYAFLALGTGLGVGLIVEGRIVPGAHGTAGELGHLAVGGRDGPRCGCGSRNCVEVWCAGAGLARRARETWPSGTLGDGTPAPRDASGIFTLARKCDPDALYLVAAARRALATAVAALLSTIDPAAISVGGTIGITQPAFVRSAVRDGAALVHWATRRRVMLRRPELGDASVLTGAAVLAYELLHSAGHMQGTDDDDPTTGP